VHTFRVVETFAAAPLNLVSGINDLELVEQGGRLMLYTATRGGGGVLALEVGATMTLVDQEAIAPGSTLPAPARIEVLTAGGVQRLVITGSNTAGLQSYGVEATGTLAAPSTLSGGLSGAISAQAVVEVGGATYLYCARAGESTIRAFAVGPTGALTPAGTLVLDGAYPGVDITSLSSVSVGGQTFLVSLSFEADVIRTFPLGPGGTVGPAQMIGVPQGLGIADPSAVRVVEIGGSSFLIVASAGSSSLTVLEVRSDGSMHVADHVIDTLDTRFAGVQALATVTDGDRVFVLSGGSDGGVQVMVLMPDGKLVLTGMMLDLPERYLDNISAMAARMVDGEIELFVAGEGAGITRLVIDVGPLAPTQLAGPEDTVLTGTAAGDMLLGQEGNDLIQGEAGADILADGSGSDTLSGGAGADIYVLAADGQADIIADFQLGVDRIDLTGWGRIYALDTLTITSTATGARIIYGDEVLEILSANGLPLRPGSFRLTDFVALWHAPPPEPTDGAILGTNQAERLDGTAGNDRFLLSAGADTINGGDGFDLLDLSAAAVGQQLSLTSSRSNKGFGVGQTYLQIEGVSGSGFSDTIAGNAVDNWLGGGDGNDRLEGLAGTDSLYGGSGGDNLIGGTGADLIDGGTGLDKASYSDATLGVVVDMQNAALNTGDAAGDRLVAVENLEGSDLADTLRGDAQANALWGGDGNDRLEGRTGDDWLYGGDGDDTLFGGAGLDNIDGDIGVNIASYADSKVAIRLDLEDTDLSTGDAARDRYRDIQGFEGSAFGDTLLGSTGNDMVWGLAGNDRMDGRTGADRLSGGAGNDWLTGGEGVDTLLGGTGADRLDGGNGLDLASYADAAVAVLSDMATPGANLGDARGDTLIGIEGLEGSAFNDTLRGGAAANRLLGGAGKDQLEGRAGNDTLFGGVGDDVLAGGAGNDILNGGEGSDWVNYVDQTAGIRADLVDWTRSRGAAALDRLTGIENLAGTAYADFLYGDAGANRLNGGAGNDRLEGRAGADALDGGNGTDTLAGGDGDDTLSGGDGNDLALGGNDADRLSGGAGNDTLDSGSGTDWLDGGIGNDRVLGGAGADTLFGGTGNDTLSGGTEADRLDAGAGNDTLAGDAGDDVLTGGDGNDVVLGGEGLDTLFGGSGNDRLDGGTEADLLDGGAGNDTLTGGAGNDVLTGADGNDLVQGDDGLDTLFGGAGNDRLDGGADVDALDGGIGNDTLDSGAGDDVLTGSDGNDLLLGGEGLDTLFGGIGNDRLDGGTGSDSLDGGAGSDTLDASSGDDALAGGGGNDTLLGGEGQDVLAGGAGNDRLEGGLGDDALTGDAGNDVFVFVGGHDVITDFTNGQDKILLEDDLWDGVPPSVAALLASVTVNDLGLTLALPDGGLLDIRGVFDATLLWDDFLFV
jgi:Ca2+-binding RTX toxin-like protein